MQKLTLFIFLSLIYFIFGGESCDYDLTKDRKISNFADCQGYSTTSTDKVCCYIYGNTSSENKISACHEFTGTFNEAIEDLYDFEHPYGGYNTYYAEADCNLGKVLGICDADERKSDTPLSPEICSKYTPFTVRQVNNFKKCCYVTGLRNDKTKVYSCVAIGPNQAEQIENAKSRIESGVYSRLGELNDVDIECDHNFISISIISIIISLLSLLS